MPLSQSSSAFPPSSVRAGGGIAAWGDVSCSRGPPMLPSARFLHFPAGGSSRWQPPALGPAWLPVGAVTSVLVRPGGLLGLCPRRGAVRRGVRGKLSRLLGTTSLRLRLVQGPAEDRTGHSNPELLGSAGNASSSVAWFALVSDALALAEPKLREKGDLSAASSAAE